MENYLNEDFYTEGSNVNTLLQILKEVSETTQCKNIEPSNLTIYSIVDITKTGLNVLIIRPDYMNAEDLFPLVRRYTYFSAENKNYVFISYSKLQGIGLTENLIEEIKEVGYFMKYTMDYGSSILFMMPSKTFLATLCKQIGCAKLPSESDPIREIFIGHLLKDAKNFKMIWRTDENINKCFACFSSKYIFEDQLQVVSKFLECMKVQKPNSYVSWYEISHYETLVRVSYTDKKYTLNGSNKKRTLIPGVIFSFSEVGDASYSLQGYISCNGSGFYVGNPILLDHKNSFLIEELWEKYLVEELKMLQILERIQHVSEDKEVNIADEFARTLAAISFEKAIGQKMFTMVKNNMTNNDGSLIDLLIALLDIVSNIRYTSVAERDKELPKSTIRRAEKMLEQIFYNKYAKEVFEW